MKVYIGALCDFGSPEKVDITIKSLEPCPHVLNSALNIQCVSYTVKADVYIKSDSAKSGNKINLPIVLRSSENLINSGATSFRAKIRFNKYNLLPIEETPLGLIIGDDRLIEVVGEYKNGVWQDTIGTLSNLNFFAPLGSTICTDLYLDSLIWSMGTPENKLENGKFCLTDVCKEGDTPRLISIDGRGEIRKISPNPCLEKINIGFEIIEKGYAKLYIMDIMGKTVSTLFSEFKEPGVYNFEYSLSELPNGFYYAILQTPTIVSVKPLEIVK